MTKQFIFNLRIDDKNEEEIINDVLTLKGFNFVVTPNLQHIVALNNEPSILDCYAKAKYVICDSRIVQVLSQILGKKIFNVIPGSDLTKYYFDKVLEPNVTIMVIGSTTVDIKKLNEIYPHLKIHHYTPPMGFINDDKEVEKTISAIQTIKPRFLFLAIGFPRQEKLACYLQSEVCFDCTAFCIGASIDFLTGKQKRAPATFQKLRLEWLYRFIQEPKRLFRRYFIESWGIFPVILKEIKK